VNEFGSLEPRTFGFEFIMQGQAHDDFLGLGG